ncbi:hypothetical protein ERW51_13575 [Aliivibrio finisterrensis]|uniref:hypothetical protein n=1 Tax=Aliivibrio finisterrensis TaxID=511998 RepID=UPI00101F01FA|nr:hypothetical protein [Aliivibrio finisterrensis]RYU66689.1 hypothetical protein ERW54_13810 [Aliivibrio finisterrensis]RYU69758.1 hypothetical protein ERW51_13575 [Aliivibrio finisterrensis]RYU73545.1 hypothetical protein ERW48_12650 [Aliivibrio finisterrensis]
MAEHNTPQFQVGQTFTDHPFQEGDGAMLELFRNDLPNMLYVGLGNITADEQTILGQTGAQFGVITSDNGGCLVVASFGDLAFEMQLNSAAIPDDYFILTEDKTLSVSMIAVDTATNLLCAIREFTLPEVLSQQFIEVTKVQRELGDVNAVNMENMQLINSLTPQALQEKMEFHPLQSVVAAPTCGCGHHHHNHAH